MKKNKWLICQITGGIILFISFISACFREHITARPFDIATLLGIFIAMVTTLLFWVGLGLEELGRIKRKMKK